MSILERKYEISVWDISEKIETKLAIIGSNDMITPARAQSPQLKRNLNGTKTLTFSLYTKYIDEIDGEEKANPFCNLLRNETRIKLKWKNKWYEFIIKNIVEDSEQNKNTYIAEDAFITELSRKGFNIELGTETENGQGTLIELEEKILENSDWTVDKEKSIIGPQLKEDVLVRLVTTKEISASLQCKVNSEGAFEFIDDTFKIPKNAVIYTFYSLLYKKDNFFQFYYDTQYRFGDDGFIINCPIYCIDKYSYSSELPKNTSEYELTTFKGKQLVRTQKSDFNKAINKYVKYYTKDKEEILGFTETEYIIDDFVTNYVTNGNNFLSDIGWYPVGNNSKIEFYSYPSAEEILVKLEQSEKVISKSYLKFTELKNNKYLFYNSGFEDNKSIINSLYEGKKFVIRLKYSFGKNNSTTIKNLETSGAGELLTGFKVKLCQYDYDENGEPSIKKVLFETALTGKSENVFKKKDGFWTAICTCNTKYTKTDLFEKNIGIFFTYEFTKTNKSITSNNLEDFVFYLEDFQLFDFKEREVEADIDEEDRDYYIPGDIISGETKIKYSYFKKDQEYDNIDDIEFEYQGYKEKNYEKLYVENFQQIRTINEKESNIFNLTQTLCESFETWADFVVEHDSLGYIKKDSKGNFIKKIVFKPFVGKENWSGFHYKTNLKSIQRTTESKQITTKTIVKANYNEFAPNGFCTIAYADENPSGESFIYDFRYYENQNLIDSATIFEELNGEQGLYSKLKKLNNQIQVKSDEKIESSGRLIELEKEKEILTAKQTELATQIATDKKQFRATAGISYAKFLTNNNKDKIMQIEGVKALFLSIYNNTIELNTTKKDVSDVKAKYSEEKKLNNSIYSNIKTLTKQKEEFILNFETKYAPFIQEGTWISESYIDHNLYYIDAKSVAATSALPQATYLINVLDLSSLEEFKNYDINLGDKTYITDPEFFGYITTGTFYTPRRQEVIISEIIEELEEPEKNKFIVQNFKTQFEDIFHRITSTTQQLKLNEGAYQRASNAFDNYGLNSDLTQNSLNTVNFTLVNSTNKWSAKGFVSSSSAENRETLKIHDGALMIFENNTWKKIISSKGINADYIYTGQLDAGKINIVSELKVTEDQDLTYAVTFDKDGLSMYEYDGSKKLRLRLGKVLENNNISDELYGLQLYNSSGEQTFKTDSNGDITISGTIVAADGLIGGWGIEADRLVHYNQTDGIDAMISTNQGEKYFVNDYGTDDWRFLLGINGEKANFGVTASGNLFANGVDIKDGNISIGDIFKITSNGGANQAMSYGLNIKLNPENQDEEIVIESDDRVIGIRERNKNGIGWTWKTILGDLTNATLGGKPLSDYGMSGYGLCTENGLFSGTIIATSGKIGGWEITEDTLVRAETKKENNEDIIVDGIVLGTNIKITNNDENFNFSLEETKKEKEVEEIYEFTEIIVHRDFELDFYAPSTLTDDIVNSNNYTLKATITDIIYGNSSIDNEHFSLTLKKENGEKYYKIILTLTEEGKSIYPNIEIPEVPEINFTMLNMEIKLSYISSKTTKREFVFPIANGPIVPLEFIEATKTKCSFLFFIFYMLYGRFPFITNTQQQNAKSFGIEDMFGSIIGSITGALGEALAKLGEDGNRCALLQKQVSTYIQKYISYLMNKHNNFVKFYDEENLIYAITEKGQSKGILNTESSFIINTEDKEETKKYKEIFSETSSSYLELFSNGSNFASEKELDGIISIIDSNESIKWRLGYEKIRKTETETEQKIHSFIKSFIIGSQIFEDKIGVWKFQIGTDNSSYSFFFDNSSNGEDKTNLSYCNLGTSENPWGNVYSKKGFYVENVKMHYSAGDTFTLQHVNPVYGYITEGNKDIYISIPLPKPVLAKYVTVSGTIIVRGIEEYVYDPQNPYIQGDTSKNRIKLGLSDRVNNDADTREKAPRRFSVSCSIVNNGIRLRLTRIYDTTNNRYYGDGQPWQTKTNTKYPNNTPVSIVSDGGNLVFSFTDADPGSET